MLNAYMRRLVWALVKFRDDWFNPEWFKPSNLVKELTRPGVWTSLMTVLPLIVFTLLCVKGVAVPFGASIDVEAFVGMLDIDLYVTIALVALPLAKMLSAWIKPKTIASIKRE